MNCPESDEEPDILINPSSLVTFALNQLIMYKLIGDEKRYDK